MANDFGFIFILSAKKFTIKDRTLKVDWSVFRNKFILKENSKLRYKTIAVTKKSNI